MHRVTVTTCYRNTVPVMASAVVPTAAAVLAWRSCAMFRMRAARMIAISPRAR